jgi:hypothetical protein
MRKGFAMTATGMARIIDYRQCCPVAEFDTRAVRWALDSPGVELGDRRVDHPPEVSAVTRLINPRRTSGGDYLVAR